MKQPVLVAGGAGYIGSHTAKALRDAGRVPVALDNLATGNRFALRYGPFEEAAIEDGARVGETLRRHGIETAIFFAGYINVGEASANPAKYYENNVVNALRFVDAARANGLKHLVFSSSCAIYGVQAKMPIAEDAAVNPLNAYAESKLFFEHALRDYDRAYGLRHVNLRYFNAAGADPAGEIGEAHDPETHLIPNAIYATMGKARLKILGTDYPTPDGTPLRDYVHVTDLADAHVRAVDYLEAGGASDSFNLGAGRGTSVLEIVRLVEEITGREVARDIVPRREGDAPALIGDNAKARRVLGWEPRLSDLRTIVQTAWAWHASRA